MQETEETQVPSLGWENPLKKEMATHSSIHAWRIPWTEEPSRSNGLATKPHQVNSGIFILILAKSVRAIISHLVTHTIFLRLFLALEVLNKCKS